VVDTTHGAHTADSIKPAQAMDQHSLQGDHAPKFVGGDLVDPAEPANTAAKPAQHGINAVTLDKTRPHGVYSMVRSDQQLPTAQRQHDSQLCGCWGGVKAAACLAPS
jgi:hypothetical protein